MKLLNVWVVQPLGAVSLLLKVSGDTTYSEDVFIFWPFFANIFHTATLRPYIYIQGID
jgi:hypothetical protein